MELHRDVVCAIALAYLVNVRDVRVIERGCGFRFLHKPPHPIPIRRKVSRQNLQRDSAI